MSGRHQTSERRHSFNLSTRKKYDHHFRNRRPSQMGESRLQTLVDEWEMRERPTFEPDTIIRSLLIKNEKHAKGASATDILEIHDTGEVITVLFPSFMANVRVNMDMLLSDFKTCLFRELAPMHHHFYAKEPEKYVFRQINHFGEMEFIPSEDIPLSKVDMGNSFPTIFLFEPDGWTYVKELNKNIDKCVGLDLDEIESELSPELSQFRAQMFNEVKSVCVQRGSEGFSHYAFPEDPKLQQHENMNITSSKQTDQLKYRIFFQSREEEENNGTKWESPIVIPFKLEMTLGDLVRHFMTSMRKYGKRDVNDPPDEQFIFQLAGKKSYLISANMKLTNYISVNSAVTSYKDPCFVARRLSFVLRNYQKPRPLHEPNYVLVQGRKDALEGMSCAIETTKKGASEYESDFVMTDFRPTAALSAVCIWDLDTELTLKPIRLKNFKYTDVEAHVVFEFRVYCGMTVLSKKRSEPIKLAEKWTANDVCMELPMKDLPPYAVIGIRVIQGRPGKKLQDEFEVGYANVSLADWRDEVLQGQVQINLWPSYDNGHRCFIGHNTTKSDSLVELTLDFGKPGCRIVIPRTEDYITMIESLFEVEEEHEPISPEYEPSFDDEAYAEFVRLIEKHQSGEKLTTEEELVFWSWRDFICVRKPDYITILADLEIIWRNRDKYSRLYMMLDNVWSNISVGAAFNLLGKRCTDRNLRRFAVNQLNLLDYSTFPMFILPLIQALKYESRANSDVIVLLLRRALDDYHVGHKLFWLLRAEISDLRNSVTKGDDEGLRVAILLEAYLRGNEGHVPTVVRQVDMVTELERISSDVKTVSKEAAIKALQSELTTLANKMSNMESPLDPVYILGDIVIEKCKVLGSAKMPLRLVWQNKNPKSEKHLPFYEMIFKNGDDLRQDMLVLQMFEVMDNIWKNHQIDSCLSIYPVLPVGTNLGIIGVVPECKTLFEIQSEKNIVDTVTSSMGVDFLNEWLRGRNNTKTRDYLESCDRFLCSLVGYSVATFVMGIKDRHSDNIMVTYDGKIFHIDFGHILGHGKTKLGFQRDRQHFVLTEHFLHVFANGDKVDKTSHTVRKFEEKCTEAYILLWQQRMMFESLFTLMQGMNLPELSTDSDLDHLKTTLQVKLKRKEDAAQYFHEIFEDTIKNSWSTKTNWLFHAFRHSVVT